MSKGVRSIIIATLLFAGMNVFVKHLAHIPPVELVMFRSFFTFFACVAIVKHKGISLLGSKRFVLVLRGVFGTLSLILFFTSLHLLPLATATLVHYITPFFTTFFGYCFLKEKFYKIQWLFLIVCFTGIIVAQSGNRSFSTFNTQNTGILYGLAATVAAAAAYNCIRKIGITDDPTVILFYFPLMSIPASIIILFFNGDFVWPIGWDWFYLLLMGAITQGAQYFMTVAYQNEKVGNIAIFTNLGIVYAIINGFLFFNEIPTLVAWLGMVIVIVGIILNVFSAKILRFFASDKNDSGIPLV